MTDTLPRPPAAAPDPDDGEHPRLLRRRHEVHRGVRADRRRRWHVLLWVLLAAVLLLGAAVAVALSPLLSVDAVTVRGAPPALAADVQRAAGVRTGSPMVRVDESEVRRRTSAVAGVASTRVRRDWPRTVVVDVVPERVVAVLEVAGARRVAGVGGRIVDVAAPPNVPALQVDPALWDGRPSATGTVPAPVAEALVLVEQLPADLVPLLGSGRLAADGTIEFRRPDDGGVVRFGPPEEIPAKVLAAATMLTGPVDLDCLSVLDLREPSRPTILRTRNCNVGPPTVGGPTTTVPRSTTTVPRSTTTVPRAGGTGARPTTTAPRTPTTVPRPTTTSPRAATAPGGNGGVPGATGAATAAATGATAGGG
ncbi:MAG: cell division protein FtsQ/DivIB [Microthrixaceae bacterium]